MVNAKVLSVAVPFVCREIARQQALFQKKAFYNKALLI